jgi:Na+/proline symporter
MSEMAIAGIAGYVLVQFLIGVWVSRRVATEQDYILAGRSLGTSLVAFSVFATWFGAEAIVASAGEIYDKGLSGALTDPFGYGVAVVIVALLLAAPLWRRGLTTYADLIATRYSPLVEKAFVLVLLPGSVFWAGAQIRSFGQILGATTGIEVATAILIAAVLVGAYSVVGGLLADAVTDVVQGAAVILGLTLLVWFVLAESGGLSASLATVDPQRLSIVPAGESGLLLVFEKLAIVICGSIVSVELISRFLGASSVRVARTGTLIGGLMYLAVGLAPFYLGLVGPGLIKDLAEPEQIVPRLAATYLPAYFYPFFIGAQISAILSVVHAALHAPAAQISHNVINPALPQLSPAARLASVRGAVLVLSVVATALALRFKSIKELVETASAFGSAGAFVVALFALFSRFGGPLAALSTLASGILVWLCGRYLVGIETPYLVSVAAALLVYVSVGVLESAGTSAAHKPGGS